MVYLPRHVSTQVPNLLEKYVSPDHPGHLGRVGNLFGFSFPLSGEYDDMMFGLSFGVRSYIH